MSISNTDFCLLSAALRDGVGQVTFVLLFLRSRKVLRNWLVSSTLIGILVHMSSIPTYDYHILRLLFSRLILSALAVQSTVYETRVVVHPYIPLSLSPWQCPSEFHRQ